MDTNSWGNFDKEWDICVALNKVFSHRKFQIVYYWKRQD